MKGIKTKIAILIILFAVIAIILSPFLLCGKMFANADPVLSTYPLLIHQNKTAKTDWMPEILGGHFDPFWENKINPDLYITKALNIFSKNTIKISHWIIALYFLLGAFFCYLFANIFFGTGISLMVSWCYVLSEFCIYRGRMAGNTKTFFFLPLLFYLILKIKENKKKYILILGIIIGLSVWIVPVQYLIYSVLAGLLYVIFLDWQSYAKQKTFWKNIKMLKSYILVGIISLFISFPFLYQNLSFAGNTAFSGGFTSASLANSDGIRIVDLLRFLSPYLFIEGFSTFPALLYFGTFTFLLLLVGIFYATRKNKDSHHCENNENKNARQNAIFFTFLFLFFLIIAFEGSPLFFIISRIPFINRFRNRTRFIFVVAFAAPFVAGYGLKYLTEAKRNISKLLSAVKYFVIFSVIGVVFSNLVSRLWIDKIIGFANKYYEQHKYNSSKTAPLSYYFRVIETLIRKTFYLFDVANYKFLAPFLFLLIGYLFLELYQKADLRDPSHAQDDAKKLQKFKFFGIGIIILNFILIYPMYHQTISVDKYLEKPKTVAFLESAEPDNFAYRVFGFRLNDFLYENVTLPSNDNSDILVKFQQETFQPNTNMVFDIHSLDGYDHMMQERNSFFIGQVGSDECVMHTETPLLNMDELTSAEKLELFIDRINLLALFNVKYIITPHKLNTAKADLAYETKVTDLQIPMYVYKIKKFMPRAYFAKNVDFVNIDNKSGLQLLLDNVDNVLDTAFIEGEPDFRFRENDNNQVQDEPANIEVIEYTEGYWEAEVNVETPSWLILNETSIDGWKAYIDGKETSIYPANYLVQSILVPQGTHKILFKFNYE